MDLFVLLRLSYYAMAATSALALSIATRNPIFVLGTLAGAIVAYATLDRHRAKPVRLEYIAALGIAVLFYTLLPLREHNGWERHVPGCFAHFLAAIQILFFFLPFRAPVLLGSFFCGLTLVVLSGVMDSNASLLLRMALFVAVTAWALFIHALWNSRERFSRRASAQSGRLSGRARPLASQPESAISRRAVVQGLTMIGLLTALCLVFGIFLYFSAPRVDDTVRYIMNIVRPDSSLATPAKGKSGVGPRGGTAQGWSDNVDLAELGPIFENQRAAVAVYFNGDPAEVSDANRRIYLRGIVFSQLREGAWVPDNAYEPLVNPAGAGPLVVVDPSLGGLKSRGVLVQQQVETLDRTSNHFFAAGPILRLGVPTAEINREGVLRLPDKQWVRNYTVWTALPIHPDHLEPGVKALHPEQARYTDTLLGRMETNALLKLLQDITPASANDLQEALAIERYLRESPRFGYTLQLDQLNRQREPDPVVEFLLSEDPLKRRGHCSYFASAFVTLCRLRNIPARLAGGFAAPLSDEARDARKVVFKNSDAHAWAEVYFKDVGWVVFDPTPGAPDPNAPVAAPKKAAPAAAAGSDSLWNRLLNFDGQQQREMYEQLGLALQEGVGGAGDLFIGESLFGWVGAALAWIGAALFVLWISRAIMGRSGRRSASGGALKGRNRAAVTFYNDLLQALSRCGYVRRPEQTPREFALHVLRAGGERFRCVLDVTDVFERVRYGGGDVTQEQFNQLQTALDHLREQAFVSTAPSKES